MSPKICDETRPILGHFPDSYDIEDGTNIFLGPQIHNDQHQWSLCNANSRNQTPPSKHKNMCGYYAIAVAILMLVNYQMLKERTCQISPQNGRQSFEIFQNFHMIALIISLILGYFHFTMVLHQFKLLFYSTALLLVSCASMILYSAIAITWTPCISTLPNTGLAKKFQPTTGDQMITSSNIFSSKDTIGILVFAFDLLASLFLVLSARLHVCPRRR